MVKVPANMLIEVPRHIREGLAPTFRPAGPESRLMKVRTPATTLWSDRSRTAKIALMPSRSEIENQKFTCDSVSERCAATPAR